MLSIQGSISGEYFHQPKEDGSSPVGLHSESECDSDDEYDSDCDDVSSLNDSHPDELVSSDDEQGNQNDEEHTREEGACGLSKESRKTCALSKDSQEKIMDSLQQWASDHVPRDHRRRLYDVQIYGYYRKSRGYGGYGVILLDEFSKPVVGYHGVSKGGSYLYYLLLGMKRGLEIADERKLPQMQWSINSRRVAFHFNNFLRHPRMLTWIFHSVCDVDDANFCERCLGFNMWLTPEELEQLLPVIQHLIQLQFKLKFKYRGDCDVRNGAAYYVAKCGAEAFEAKMKPGVSSDGVEEVELKMEELGRILYY